MAQSQTPMTICKKQRLAQYRIFIRIETGPVSHRLYYKSYNAQLWLPNADDIMLMVQSKLYLSSGLLVFSNISQNICKDWGKLPCWYILQASNILRFYSWQDFRMLLSIQLYLMINYELLFGISMGVLSFYYFVYLKLTEIQRIYIIHLTFEYLTDSLYSIQIEYSSGRMHQVPKTKQTQGDMEIMNRQETKQEGQSGAIVRSLSKPSFKNLINIQKQKVASREKTNRSHSNRQSCRSSSNIKQESANNTKNTKMVDKQGYKSQLKQQNNRSNILNFYNKQVQANRKSVRLFVSNNKNLKQNQPNFTRKNYQPYIQCTNSSAKQNIWPISEAENHPKRYDNNQCDLFEPVRLKKQAGCQAFSNNSSYLSNISSFNQSINKIKDVNSSGVSNLLIKSAKRLKKLQHRLKEQQKYIRANKLVQKQKSHSHHKVKAVSQQIVQNSGKKLQRLSNFLDQYQNELKSQTDQIQAGYMLKLEELTNIENTNIQQVTNNQRQINQLYFNKTSLFGTYAQQIGTMSALQTAIDRFQKVLY